MRRTRIGGAIAIVLIGGGLITLALTGAGPTGLGSSGPSGPPSRAEIRSAHRHLRADEAQAARVVDGSIEQRVADLRGIPVVVNQWASWCPNCREEFPLFRRLSTLLRGKVAFLGLDSQDEKGSAETFLGRYPVGYPSIFDGDSSQAASIGGGLGWPTTIYFDRNGGRTYVREGGYVTLRQLREDVEIHALRR